MERNMKRSITSAIVAGALLVGVACSGGGNVTPRSGATVELPTPVSVSPANVKAAPMAKTTILPASAMTGRRPATAIVPQSWTQIPGTATQVTAAPDGSIYVLSDQPSGTDKYIWHYSSGTWTNIAGLASQIAAAPNGTLWAINAGGGIYAYSAGAWTTPGGGAKSIATLRDNTIAVISNSGSGDQAIWHLAGGVWTQWNGAGVSLAGGRDSTGHVVNGGSVALNGTYILNAAGAIYYENTDKTFAQFPASASVLASRPGGLFALASGPIAPGGNSIYYYDLDNQGQGWVLQTGAAASLAVGLNDVMFVVGSNHAIYTTPTDPAAPLVVSPNPIALTQTGNSNVTITETGFSGPITVVSGDTNILTVSASPVTMTAGSATATINAITSGSTTLTVSDGTQQVVVPVHVTITGVVISGSH
jgi:hypothetical protein